MHRSLALLLLLTCLALGLVYLSAGGRRSDPDLAKSAAGQPATERKPFGRSLPDAPAPSERPRREEFGAAQENSLPESARRPAVDIDRGTLRLRVSTWTTLRSGSRGLQPGESVPNVPFVLLRPAAKPQPEVLLRGQTDSLGVQVIELDTDGRLFELLTSGSEVFGHADLGFESHVAAIDQAKDAEWDYELRLVAVPGLTIRGEVRTADGQRELAKIFVEFQAPGVSTRSPVGENATYSMRGGSFSLHLSTGGIGDLIADGGELGVASIRGMAFVVGTPSPYLVLHLGGTGRLRGRVINGLGGPVNDLPLFVQLLELEDGSGDPKRKQNEQAQLMIEGMGRPRAELTTNADGEFNGAALKEGNYVVRARLPGVGGPYPFLLTSSSVRASGEPLELRFTRPHLLVRLLDADGSEWSGGTISTRVSRGERLPAGEDWPTTTQMIVAPCSMEGGRAQVKDKFLTGREVRKGQFVFELMAGQDYQVGATGPGFGGQLQLVRALPGSDRQVVELTASAGLALGHVRVKARFPGSEVWTDRTRSFRSASELLEGIEAVEPQQAILDSLMNMGAVGAQLIQVETGLPVVSASVRHGADLVLSAPPGHYRLEVDYDAIQAQGPWGQSTAAVRIDAGQETVVEVSLALRSLLAITIAGNADPVALVRGRDGEEVPGFSGLFLRLEDSHGVGVPLTRKRGSASVWSQPREPEAWSAAWPFGETNLSGPVPAGRYELVGRVESGREVRTPVLLSPGKVSAVTLEF